MNKVVIFQYRLLHYRVELFERLRKQCLGRNITLHLVHGQASPRELAKKDEGRLPWARTVANRFWEMRARDLVWEPFPTELRDADLVVVMQENRILSNYPLLFSRLWSPRKVAFWGHGVNFQARSPLGLRERWKRLILKRVDWWFAYTELSANIVRSAGYPSDRITCLNNSIDNEGFEQDLTNVETAQVRSLRSRIDASAEAPVGLFCGSLYPDKRLDYLFAAAELIHASLPDFRLVVIGDGPSAIEIRAAMQTRPWIHWVGVKKGAEKAAWFRLANVIMNPGLVGLHVLDSFCAGIPMVTTAEARHSPEIAYLKNGVNGIVVRGGPEDYAEAVVGLLKDCARLDAIGRAARQDARRYTLDNMVHRFADGIERCLSKPSKR